VQATMTLGEARDEWSAIEAPALTVPGAAETIKQLGAKGLVYWRCELLGLKNLVLDCPAHIQTALWTNSSTAFLSRIPEGRYRLIAKVRRSEAVHIMVVRPASVASWARVLPCPDRLRAGDDFKAQAQLRGTMASGVWMLVEVKEDDWDNEATFEAASVGLDSVRAVALGELALDTFSGVFSSKDFQEGVILGALLAYGPEASVAGLLAEVRAELAKEGRRSRAAIAGDGLWFFASQGVGKVNRKPTGGVVAISPAVGHALETPFHVSSVGWQDEEIEYMKYEFCVLLDQGHLRGNRTEAELIQLAADPRARRLLPISRANRIDPWVAPAGHHLVIARVQDHFGAEAAVAGDVFVYSASPEELAERAIPALQLAEGSNNGFAIMEAVLAVVQAGSVSEDTARALSGSLARIVTITEACDELAVGMATAMKVILGSGTDPDNLVSAVTSLSDSLLRIGSEGYHLSTPAARSLFSTVVALATMTSPSVGPDFGQQVMAASGLLGMRIRDRLEVGEWFLLSEEGVDMRVDRGWTAEQSNGTLGVMLFGAAERRLMGWACDTGVDVVHSHWRADKDPLRLLRRVIAGPVHTFHFSCDGRDLEVTLTAEVAVEVEPPAQGTNFQYECVLTPLDQPAQHTILPGRAERPGVVFCNISLLSSGFTIAGRVSLAAPAPEASDQPVPAGEVAELPADTLVVEPPPVPIIVEENQLPVAIIATCAAVVFISILAGLRFCFAKKHQGPRLLPALSKLGMFASTTIFEDSSTVPVWEAQGESSPRKSKRNSPKSTRSSKRALSPKHGAQIEVTSDKGSGATCSGEEPTRLSAALEEARAAVDTDTPSNPSFEVSFDDGRNNQEDAHSVPDIPAEPVMDDAVKREFFEGGEVQMPSDSTALLDKQRVSTGSPGSVRSVLGPKLVKSPAQQPRDRGSSCGSSVGGVFPMLNAALPLPSADDNELLDAEESDEEFMT